MLPPERNPPFVYYSSFQPSRFRLLRPPEPALLHNWYDSSITVELIPHKERRPLLPRVSNSRLGDRALTDCARPPQQLGGIGLEHVTTDFTVKELAVFPGVDQPGAHQLFDVVRDGSFRDGEFLAQPLTGALLFARNDFQHLHSPGIRQCFGDELELLVGQARPGVRWFLHSSMVIEPSYICQEGAIGDLSRHSLP